MAIRVRAEEKVCDQAVKVGFVIEKPKFENWMVKKEEVLLWIGIMTFEGVAENDEVGWHLL